MWGVQGCGRWGWGQSVYGTRIGKQVFFLFNRAVCLYKEKKEYYLSDDAFLHLDPVLQQDMNSSVA